MDDFAYFPQVIRIWPTMNDPASGAYSPIYVDWSMEMDPNEFATDELNKHVLLYDDLNGNRILLSGTCSKKRTTFTPLSPLSPDSEYRLLLEAGTKSITGRGLRTSVEGRFVVESTFVSAPVLVSPPDGSSYAGIPTLSWNAVSAVGATGISYLVEVDDSPSFLSPNWTTTTSGLTVAPALTDVDNKTWFWKVTAIVSTSGGVSSGAVSFPRAFYITDKHRPSVTTQSQFAYSDEFQVVESAFESGLSNQGDFPSLVFDFSYNITLSASDYIQIVRTHADGRVDQPLSFYEKIVSFTATVSGNRLTIVVTESAKPYDNYRYEVRILKGLTDEDGTVSLDSTLVYSFSGHYLPYYCNPASLHADFGDLLSKVPEDLINFHIYKSSLDAQAQWMSSFRMYFMPLIGGIFSWLPESTVRDSRPSISYAIHRWVELDATRKLLKMFMMEHAQLIGSSRKLGDLSEEWNADSLKLTTSILDDLKHEKIYWEQFLNPTPLPRTTTKSSLWNPAGNLYDRTAPRRKHF